MEWSGAIINDIIRAEVGEGEGARPSLYVVLIADLPASREGSKE